MITCIYNELPSNPGINAWHGVDPNPDSQDQARNHQLFWEYELGIVSILIYHQPVTASGVLKHPSNL